MFFRPKCLQEQLKHARSSTKISMMYVHTRGIKKYIDDMNEDQPADRLTRRSIHHCYPISLR
jgi:hypothetical protein